MQPAIPAGFAAATSGVEAGGVSRLCASMTESAGLPDAATAGGAESRITMMSAKRLCQHDRAKKKGSRIGCPSLIYTVRYADLRMEETYGSLSLRTPRPHVPSVKFALNSPTTASRRLTFINVRFGFVHVMINPRCAGGTVESRSIPRSLGCAKDTLVPSPLNVYHAGVTAGRLRPGPAIACHH